MEVIVFCTFGSGIAAQIKQQFTEAYAADCKTIKGDKTKLGTFTSALIPKYDFTICNAYTQYSFGMQNGKPPVDYDAVKSSMELIKNQYDSNDSFNVKIGIPKIGAGLAMGDWNKIEKIIDDIGFSDITCVIYDKQF